MQQLCTSTARRGTASTDLTPSLRLVPGSSSCTTRRQSGNPPKAPPRGSRAATGGGVGQTYERGTWAAPASYPGPSDRPTGRGPVIAGEAPKLHSAAVGRSFPCSPSLPALDPPLSGGPSPSPVRLFLRKGSLASEARQAEGATLVVNGPPQWGMWGTGQPHSVSINKSCQAGCPYVPRRGPLSTSG